MKRIRYSIVDDKICTEKVKSIGDNTLLFSYPCNSNFSCTPYRVILSNGIYLIECYGAGNNPNRFSSGGGYISGIIRIDH